MLNNQIKVNDMLNKLLNYYNKSVEDVIIKIKKKYNHDKIKKKINLIYNNIIVENIKTTIKMNNKFIRILEKSIKDLDKLRYLNKKYMKIQSKIFIKLYFIKENIQRIYVVTTDLNFLRRFLDKDYIKNTIIYTGLEHLSDITYLLIKYFNFKLTNICYRHEEIDIHQINQIKNFKYLDKLNNYFSNSNIHFNPIQCSNLFDFPINFS
jgi:hypothetical protein